MFPVAWCVTVDTQLVSPRRPCHLLGGVFLLMRRTPRGAAWVGKEGLRNLYQGCSDPQPQVDSAWSVQCWVLLGPSSLGQSGV